MANRYGVERCDEGGTLSDNEGNPIDHTWDVIDRTRDDGNGHFAVVSNHDTRTGARRMARVLNFAPCARSMGCLCAAHANGSAAHEPCNTDETNPNDAESARRDRGLPAR